MGGSVSTSASGGLGEFPECCVAMILSRLDAPEICKLAQMNKAFRKASLGDFVWEPKLPKNYEFIVRKLLGESESRSKREIYSWLWGAVGFDDATKELWLEKKSGKMCIAISWKGLKITGINDRRYWSQLPSHQSRFHDIAYLRQVWWLEVKGEFEFNFAAGNYSLYFRLQVGKIPKGLNNIRARNLDQAHGWDIKPVHFQMSTSNGEHSVSECYLKEGEGWVDYHVGDFAVENHHCPLKIEFSMTQIDCTHTKGGLWLDCVTICPTN